MNFDTCPEFDREVKRLSKKWRSLPDDLNDAKIQINSLYVGEDEADLIEYRAAFFNNKRASILNLSKDVEVVKMRLDVAALSRNDKVRLIFVAIKSRNEIKFIELFAKNEKSREDQKRIRKYL